MTPLEQLLYRFMLLTFVLERLGRHGDAYAVLERLVLPVYVLRQIRKEH